MFVPCFYIAALALNLHRKHLKNPEQLSWKGERGNHSQEQTPCGFVTRHAPIWQMPRAYASVAQGMRCYSKEWFPQKTS